MCVCALTISVIEIPQRHQRMSNEKFALNLCRRIQNESFNPNIDLSAHAILSTHPIEREISSDKSTIHTLKRRAEISFCANASKSKFYLSFLISVRVLILFSIAL